MNKYEARPTEYNGVVFRSKTEAIFARSIDLMGGLWHYEPESFATVSGWCPDFWTVFNNVKGGLVSILLELKPCAVTQTYKDELMRRFELLQLGTEHRAALVCGSPFNKDVERTMEMIIDGKWRVQEGWIFSRMDQAMQHRFDLKPVEKERPVSTAEAKNYFQALRDSLR